MYYYRQNDNSTIKNQCNKILERNSKDRVFVINKIKEISKHYKFNKKITRIFVDYLKYFEYYDRYKYGKMYKVVFKIQYKYFKFRRKLGVKFGI